MRIVHMVTDGDGKAGKSGTTLLDERPGLMEAVEWIAEGKADGILAPNLDRLARELTVQETVLSYVGRPRHTASGPLLGQVLHCLTVSSE
ncbi:recombinase family protein [Streptomyces tibetensis]|uniref:recombinase family protein n=1 Tax=Streptomyces tibetensis TaxID=2382123 RepID=UPI0034009231